MEIVLKLLRMAFEVGRDDQHHLSKRDLAGLVRVGNSPLNRNANEWRYVSSSRSIELLNWATMPARLMPRGHYLFICDVCSWE
jgi:hypothetical protein